MARRFNDTVQHKVHRPAADTAHSFEPGAWVVVPWRGGKPTKLSTNYRGPYLVTKKLSATRYEVQDPADMKTYKKHINELFGYNLGEGEDLRDVIAMDEVEQLVEAIIDHSTNGSRRKSDFDFKVRWKGMTAEDDSWIPYKEARPLEAFGKYLEQHLELKIS